MSHSTQPAAKAQISTQGEREIVIERVFAAPRERLWAAFTEPQLIARWWGLRSTTTVVEELDLRPGGAWRFVERSDDGTYAFRGVYREVSAPERLVYTFEWEGMPGHVAIETIDFEDLGGRTMVRTHTLFHDGAERDGMLESGMERGVNEGYAALDELLAAS